MTLLNLSRTILLSIVVALLGACANTGMGISIPVGPFGSIGIGMNGAGQVSGNVGIGTSVGGVGIGGGTSFPLGTVGGAAPAANPTPGATPASAQTGSSQNVPR